MRFWLRELFESVGDLRRIKFKLKLKNINLFPNNVAYVSFLKFIWGHFWVFGVWRL